MFTFHHRYSRLLSNDRLQLQLSNNSHMYPYSLPYSLFLSILHTNTQSNTQAPNAFYFCDHNYLMTGLLVSQPPFCTLDLSVNNLALRARKVGPLKQQVQANSGSRTQRESIAILSLSSAHSLLTALYSGCCASIELYINPSLNLSILTNNPSAQQAPRCPARRR